MDYGLIFFTFLENNIKEHLSELEIIISESKSLTIMGNVNFLLYQNYGILFKIYLQESGTLNTE